MAPTVISQYYLDVEKNPHITAFVFVLISAIMFRMMNALLRSFVPEKAAEKSGRWTNIATSMVHGGLCSVLIVISLWTEPYAWMNMKELFSPLMLAILYISGGYFLYDTFDVFRDPDNLNKYMMIHHATVLGSLFVAIWYQMYIALCAYGLIVEVNSIFLHWRQLLIFTGHKQNRTTLFTAVVALNLLTFFVFRMGTLVWLYTYFLNHYSEFPTVLMACGIVFLNVVNLMNAILLYRLLNSDLKLNERFLKPLWGRCQQMFGQEYERVVEAI